MPGRFMPLEWFQGLRHLRHHRHLPIPGLWIGLFLCDQLRRRCRLAGFGVQLRLPALMDRLIKIFNSGGEGIEVELRLPVHLFLLLHGPQHVVLDESRRGLRVVNPAAQWGDELLGLNGPRSVHIDHLEELLQIDLIDVHDPQSTLELLVLPGALYELFKCELTTAIFVYPFEDLLQKLLVVFMVSLHLFSQIQHIPLSRFGKGVHDDSYDEVQHTKDQGQQGAHEDDRRRRIFHDHGDGD
mmetsp:Transcript_4299/g.10329  ORF Transcript_4299/g.10329 Transcript_4299/m.10329 type:complete len:241 (+) Transcript_4299:230-952(+)